METGLRKDCLLSTVLNSVYEMGRLKDLEGKMLEI